MIVTEGNRCRAARNFKFRAAIDATLTALKAQLAGLDGDIEDLVRHSPL